MAVATTARLSERQTALKAKLEEVTKAFTRTEFAKHVVQIAAKSDGRKFASEKAVMWHVQQLVGHGKPISGWVADYLDQAADDMLVVPKVKQPDLKVVSASTGDTLRDRMREITLDIQSGMNIRVYNKRTWGHGIWNLVGKVAVAAARRHGLRAETYKKDGDTHSSDFAAIGKRIADFIDKGHVPFSSTMAVMEAMVADWDDGFRLTPEMLVGSKVSTDTVPENLRSKEETVVGVKAFDGDVEEPEIAVDDAHEMTVVSHTTAIDPDDARKVADRMYAAAQGASVVPAAWEDGEMPLHLEALAVALKLHYHEDRIDALINVARKTLLTELRSL